MIHIQHDDVKGVLASLGFREIQRLDQYGLLADWPEEGVDRICEQAALRLGGQWYPQAEQITWSSCGRAGRDRRGVTIVHPVALQDAQDARRVARSLGVECHSWSVGNVARTLLKWLGPCPPAFMRVGGIENVLFEPMAYSHCHPGQYDWLSMYDIDHAYWQFTRRLPSLLCMPTDDGHVHWIRMEPDLKERWKDLQEAVQTCKPLRLRMHGCMIGVRQPYEYYTRNGKRETPPMWGPYASAATIAKRGVYELTQMQARETPYANTDCVCLGRGERPTVWDRYGVRYKLEHEGPGILAAVGGYRIGDYESGHYRWQSDLIEAGFHEIPEVMPEEPKLIDKWWQ